jgi:ribosome maturation factor RimP
MIRTVEERISDLLEEKFQEEGFTDCFLVDMNLNTAGNKLEVFIDSDSGITFEKCQSVSRHLETYLDEEKPLGEKYTLEVSSPGVDRPLKLPRQYHKNIGRKVEVTPKEGKPQTGTLVEVTDFAITIEEKVKIREGKKTRRELVQTLIPFEDIEKTIVKITF